MRIFKKKMWLSKMDLLRVLSLSTLLFVGFGAASVHAHGSGATSDAPAVGASSPTVQSTSFYVSAIRLDGATVWEHT